MAATEQGKHYERVCQALKTRDEDSIFFQEWKERISEFRQICPYRKSANLIAILTCYLVARSSGIGHSEAMNINLPPGSSRGFNLRGIAKDVAEISVANNIDIGSRSPDCLNASSAKSGDVRNISDIKTGSNMKGITLLHQIIEDVSNMQQQETTEVLYALIETGIEPVHEIPMDSSSTLAGFMTSAIEELRRGSNHGNTLVSVVAGCVQCTLKADEAMHVGKTNDPDRKYPCDITVYKKQSKKVTKSYEVKDKIVSAAEIKLSLRKMKRETFVPPEIVFCLCRGIQKNAIIETIEAIHEQGATSLIFTDVIAIITHFFMVAGMSEEEFCQCATEEMCRVKGCL